MKTLEFDRFLEETRQEQLQVVVRGQTFTCPLRLPALVPLRMARAQQMENDERRETEYRNLVFEAADQLFGPREMDRICALGLSAQEVALLIQKVFEVINGREEPEGEELSDEDSRRSVRGGKA